MSSSAADATANELLASFLRSNDPAQADSILADLIFRHARPLALAEGAVGLFVTGFFVVVLANRLRH